MPYADSGIVILLLRTGAAAPRGEAKPVIHKTPMKILRDESGQTLVLTALAMTCLLGILALATDVGTLLYDRRMIQSAADSAAIAGAKEIRYATIDGTTVDAVAKAAATQNGFTDGSNGVTVTVNSTNGPVSGPHAGNPSYVEVIVQQVAPTIFMKVFNRNSTTVSARAVAGLGGVNKYCAFLLDPTDPSVLQDQGNAVMNFNNCGLMINSNSATALQFTGGAGTINAPSVAIVGGGNVQRIVAETVTGVAPVSDPLGFLTLPDTNSLSCTAPSGGTLTGSIGPGSAGGTVCYSGNVTLTNVTLNQGTYVFTGNVTLSGNVSTGTGGATIDLASGSLTANTGSTLNLTAPTTGSYSGIALMAPASNTNQLTFGTGTASGAINGIIYAPGAQLFLHDNAGSLNITSDLIVKSVYNKASTLTVTSYSQAHPSTSVLKFAGLAE